MAKWHIEGYKNQKLTDNVPDEFTRVRVLEMVYDTKHHEKSLEAVFRENNLDSISIVEIEEEPHLLKVSDIDLSNTVFFELSNPYYVGDECNVMETSFEFPNERMHIIHIIKLAVRCGLDIKFHSYNEKANKWVHEYYEYYRS